MFSLCKPKFLHFFKWFHKVFTNLRFSVKKTLLLCDIANLQFKHLFFVTVCPKNMHNQKRAIKHQPIVQMSSSLDQWTIFSLCYWYPSILTVLITSWPHVTRVKITTLAILTNMAYDQIVTNMDNMSVHQKRCEKLVH